jgi:hypothetical protein
MTKRVEIPELSERSNSLENRIEIRRRKAGGGHVPLSIDHAVDRQRTPLELTHFLH